jgi:hypothetical protein
LFREIKEFTVKATRNTKYTAYKTANFLLLNLMVQIVTTGV